MTRSPTLVAWLASFSDRCDFGYHLTTQHPGACRCQESGVDAGLAAKAHGQQAATDAHPDDRAKVEAAIRQLAATGRPFSANDARAIHGVKGGTVGATFTALRQAGVIRACGDETSSDAGTHGHRIFRWEGVAA